jgi:ATP-dependent RNA helicase SUPV3L1/SUV3
MKDGAVPAEWFSSEVAMLDRTDGDIDTLSNRIAQVRTWTFVANRPDWLKEPEHWQAVTRRVEDSLSDALHERLAQRFVDRRTSVLMRRLREKARMEAEITATGDVSLEGQHVGHLHGFHFVPDPQAAGEEAKALRNAAQQGLASEIEARAERFSAAADSSLVLSNDGVIRWLGDPVAKLEPGEKLFEPRPRVVADEELAGPARDKVEARLKAWLKAHIVRLLGPLLTLEESPELTGIARGIGFQIAEALGVLERSRVVSEVRGLDQDGRAALRKQGIRFGAYHLYLPALLKPAPRLLATQLWALKHGGLDQKGVADIAHLASSGRTSIPVDPEIAKGLYRAAGFRVCGGRAVRVDILERLADLIRPAINYRPGLSPGPPPPGTADNDAFIATVGMTSLAGCSGEDFGSILKSLGYAADRRAGPAITVPLLQPAAVAPAPGPEPAEAEAAATSETEPGQPSELPESTPPAEASAAAEEPPAPVVEVSTTIERDAAEMEAQGLQSAGADHALATELMAEAGVTLPGDEAVAEGSPPVEAVEAAEAAPADAAAAAVEPVEPAGSAAAAEPAAGEPAEPILIEVWRLHRHHHREAGPCHARGRPDQRRGARPDAAAGAARHQDRPPRQERRADATPRPDPRPDRGPGKSDERRGAPRGDRAQARRENNGKGPRPEHRPDQRQDRRPERREKAPDPNSPFAKLLALKQQLESRDTDKR